MNYLLSPQASVALCSQFEGPLLMASPSFVMKEGKDGPEIVVLRSGHWVETDTSEFGLLSVTGTRCCPAHPLLLGILSFVAAVAAVLIPVSCVVAYAGGDTGIPYPICIGLGGFLVAIEFGIRRWLRPVWLYQVWVHNRKGKWYSLNRLAYLTDGSTFWTFAAALIYGPLRLFGWIWRAASNGWRWNRTSTHERSLLPTGPGDFRIYASESHKDASCVALYVYKNLFGQLPVRENGVSEHTINSAVERGSSLCSSTISPALASSNARQ